MLLSPHPSVKFWYMFSRSLSSLKFSEIHKTICCLPCIPIWIPSFPPTKVCVVPIGGRLLLWTFAHLGGLNSKFIEIPPFDGGNQFRGLFSAKQPNYTFCFSSGACRVTIVFSTRPVLIMPISAVGEVGMGGGEEKGEPIKRGLRKTPTRRWRLEKAAGTGTKPQIAHSWSWKRRIIWRKGIISFFYAFRQEEKIRGWANFGLSRDFSILTLTQKGLILVNRSDVKSSRIN